MTNLANKRKKSRSGLITRTSSKKEVLDMTVLAAGFGVFGGRNFFLVC
jgi:hypothetical protein